MIRLLPAVLVLALGVLVAGPPPAVEVWPAPRSYVCYRTAGPIVVDGKLDEPTWTQAAWSDSFVDIEGNKKPLPRHRTRMKMAWNDDGLYIGAELDEPHLWANLKNHDSVIFHDNDFEVFIDHDGDNHVYGELELNALNTTWDLLLTKPYKDGGRAIDSWEIKGLKTAVHLDGTLNDPRDNDRGWSIEIFIPYTSIREMHKLTVPVDGEQWRINFSRVEWDTVIKGGEYVKVPNRKENNWVWSPQGVIDMHRPERWGILQFSTAPPGKAAAKPDPGQLARDYLHQVYYSQRSLLLDGRQPMPLDQLGIPLPKGLKDAKFEHTKSMFEATVTQENGSKYRIESDSRFTRLDPLPPKK